MVSEFLSQPGWGGHAQALRWVEESLKENQRSYNRSKRGELDGGSIPSGTVRPWVIVEASPPLHLYVPSFSPHMRHALAEGQLLWIRTCCELAPETVQLLLESGLCEGVLLNGQESFSKATPAGVWGRRWQLAAKKGNSHLVWVHEREVPALIGFDIRLHWTAPLAFEIRRGHGYFENQQRGSMPANASIEVNHGQVAQQIRIEVRADDTAA